jgi:hypothetical protein
MPEMPEMIPTAEFSDRLFDLGFEPRKIWGAGITSGISGISG